jgi:hypothetical protein
MNLEKEIEELAGIKVGAPLDTHEILLYENLQDVRNRLALQFIPPAFREEFNTLVFPDHNLRWYAQALARNRELHSKAVSGFLSTHMRASVTAGGFGQKLSSRGVRPEDVMTRMMQVI